jgi:hypothetical protein
MTTYYYSSSNPADSRETWVVREDENGVEVVARVGFGNKAAKVRRDVIAKAVRKDGRPYQEVEYAKSASGYAVKVG